MSVAINQDKLNASIRFLDKKGEACLEQVRLENPDEKYIYIMYALDSFVLNEGEPSFA